MTCTIAFLWPKADFDATGLSIPDGFDVRFGHSANRAEAERACVGADYIVVASGFGRVDSDLLDIAPNVRLVQLTGAGFDNVDHAACASRGIPVAYMPGKNAPSVAQLVVQMAFRLCRPLPILTAGGEEAWQKAREQNLFSQELPGQVGVIGYGPIGRHVAAYFAGLGCSVTRAAHDQQDDEAVPAASIDEILRESDIVAICLPFRPETKNLLNRERLSQIKRGAVLINVGRGGVVDEAAIVDLLKTGHLGGIGFDVYAEEPISPDHPFLDLPDSIKDRVILTPHIAGQTRDSKRRNFRLALENVQRVAAGDPPLDLVKKS